MKRIFKNQSGAVLITFAILLIAVLGFVALATEAGRWYLVRSELSKAVDAAALAGAQNISNPYVTPDIIAQQVGAENFSAGQLGTDPGSVSFTTTHPQSNEFQVVGNVSAIAILARLFGIELVPVSSSGVGQQNKVEIMVVLDSSASLDCDHSCAIGPLKQAATSFVSFFSETEDKDKMGLISFAYGVTVQHALSNYFVTDMTAKIGAIQAAGATNAEDAIAQAGKTGGQGQFTDQTNVPPDQRIKQYLIFFTDGHPTAFTSKFKWQGNDYYGVMYALGPCTPGGPYYPWSNIYNSLRYLMRPDYPSGAPLYSPPSYTLLYFMPTGDGNSTSVPPLTNCTSPTGYWDGYQWVVTGNVPYDNMRWYIFDQYPLSGHGPLECSIDESALLRYVCDTAQNMTLDNAQALKDKGIKIYTIGLGLDDFGKNFLSQIASGPAYEYNTPTSDQLQAIFNAIAKEIKLRLVS